MSSSKLLFAGLIVLLSFSLKGQELHSTTSQKIEAIFQAWDDPEMPGGVVGIVDKGELVWSKAYGMASLEYGVPNTTSTVFNIASVSKQITAFSLVLLEQQGKLSLDDEVRKHLKEMPDFGKKITIRHLLHHTSGLRNFQSMLSMAGWREGEAMTNEDLLRYLSQQKELNFEPGSEYLYCNTGFNIATAIVERITGQSFQDWTKENIFEPLGMSHSSYREDLEAIHKNTATCYDGNAQEGFRQPLKYWTYMGNGNVYTTVEDLSKWMNNFRDPQLGGQAAIQKLVTSGILNNGTAINYGLGIGVGEYRGLKRYSHGGSVGGYRSNMIYFPEPDKGIILITNFSSANPGAKVTAIADLLLTDVFPSPKTTQPANSSNLISRQATSFNADLYKEFVGNYYVDGVVVELTLDKGVPRIFAAGALPAPLVLKASSDSTFFVEGVDLAIKLMPDNRMRVNFQGDNPSGFKIQGGFANQALKGVYYSPELDTRYTIIEKDGQLMALHSRHNSFAIIPTSEDQLYGTAYFFSDIKVVRENGAIKGLKVSNGRVRNMWFEKLE